MQSPKHVSSIATWSPIPDAQPETWRCSEASGQHAGTYAEIYRVSLGWTAKTHIVINEMTHVDYLYPGFYELREHAQAWCEQWLHGRTSVRFDLAPSQYRVSAPMTATEIRS